MKNKAALLMILMVLLFSTGGTNLVMAQSAVAQVGFFEEYQVRPGGMIEVPVEVRDVEELFAIDIEIAYDPDILVFEDADPAKEGVQPALGTFLDAGLTLFFEVDENEGLIRLAMTQVNPAEPKSGDGVIMVLYFTGVQEGESELVINFVDLSTRFGEEIPSELQESTVLVSAAAEESITTPIPVQDPNLMIPIPTLEPTPTPTEVPPSATATMPTLEPTPVEESSEIENEGQELSDESSEQMNRFSILQYWWAVLMVVLLAVGLAIYVFVFRKPLPK